MKTKVNVFNLSGSFVKYQTQLKFKWEKKNVYSLAVLSQNCHWTLIYAIVTVHVFIEESDFKFQGVNMLKCVIKTYFAVPHTWLTL